MKNKGLTLVEVLIVVILIGILAAIAIPTIQQSAENARKKEAIIMLNSIWAAEKAHYLDERSYTDSLAQLPTVKISPSSLQYYDYSVSVEQGDGMSPDFLALAIREDGSYLTINKDGEIKEGKTSSRGVRPGSEE